jgi:hypothetical protein
MSPFELSSKPLFASSIARETAAICQAVTLFQVAIAEIR